jgi:hypothetical protein
MAPAVSEMVQSSRTSAALETNGMVGAAQSDAMRSRYQGLVVHMGDQSYPVSTAAWRDHGPEFRRMKKMKGPTFNDLPTRTDEERLHKRNIAKAILYVELRNILSGDPFCVDRHGRNIRINNNAIGHFDHGAVHAVVRDTDGHQVNPIDADKALRAGGTVEIPGASKEELLQLAEALYSSFQQLAAHAPLAVVIHNEIAKAREASGETPEYLIRVERALLALNDCFKCLDQEGQDIKDLLGSLYLNNEVHPTICAELEKKIAKEKVGGLLGRFVKISSRVRTEVGTMIREKIHTSVHTTESMPASHWHDHPKNTREFTTLLGTKDYEVQRSEKRQKTRRRSSES